MSATSPFLYLKQKGKVLKQDLQKYQQANSTLYKKEGFKFLYLVLLAKLCDMGNLPVPKNQKMVFYSFSVMALASISFYRSSLPMVQMLEQLDNKYTDQYSKYVRNSGFQGINN